MPQTLNIRNFGQQNVIKQTTLTADTAAGATSLGVQSNTDFAAGPVLIGAPGSPYAEIITITSPTPGQTLPVSGTAEFAHNNGDPVYMLFGNQIKLYSAADVYGTGQQPPDINFAQVLTGSPFNIDGSSVNTSFKDSAGTPGIWYKFTYFNSTSTAETQLADSKAVQAGQVHYVSLDQIRRRAGFADSPNITNDIIAEKRDSAEREVNGALLPVYNFPLPQPTNPIIEQITLGIAAGELMHEQYLNISSAQADKGAAMAHSARHGGGDTTSLDELVTRKVVLTDANFTEQTIEEGHGFGGWPDGTTQNTPTSQGGDHGPQFKMDEIY